jgi:hypothetical protein
MTGGVRPERDQKNGGFLSAGEWLRAKGHVFLS